MQMHIKKLTIFLTFFLSISYGSLFSQEENTFTGSFTDFKAQGRVEVELVASGANEVLIIEQDGLESSDVSVEFKSGLLIVKSLKVIEDGVFKVRVQYSSLKNITVDAGAQVYSDEIWDVDNSKLDVSTGGTFEAKIAGNRVDVIVGQGAMVGLSGSVNYIDAKGNTGGILQAGGLYAKEAELKANTGAVISLKTAEIARTKALTGGVIKFIEKPTQINVETSLGGKVDFE